MNNLFGKGRERILEYFYSHKLRESYFSEILRETKLTPNTTLQHLSTLEHLRLVVTTKKKANTFYRLQKSNPQIYSLLSYFDFQRFNQLPVQRKDAITSFLEQLQIKPLIVVLFGSTAKGSYTNKSDVDLLVVYNQKEFDTGSLSEDVEAITGVLVQPIVIDVAYFEEQLLKEEDKVIVHAIKTGYPLQGFEQFYKRLLR